MYDGGLGRSHTPGFYVDQLMDYRILTDAGWRQNPIRPIPGRLYIPWGTAIGFIDSAIVSLRPTCKKYMWVLQWQQRDMFHIALVCMAQNID